MLDIRTFDARSGGNVLYKALAHPLAADAIAALYGHLREAGPVWLFDPDDNAGALLAMHPDAPRIEGVLVQDVRDVGTRRCGQVARPLTDLPRSGAACVLIAAFDAAPIAARIAHMLPAGAVVASLDEARLPVAMQTNPRRTLDPLNYATNHAFFRDQGGLSTRLVTANYWAGYGAGAVRLWLRLFDTNGAVLATWEQALPPGVGGVVLDSAEIRARFGLPEFTGQLFIHAIGVAGHDVVKYALDTYDNVGGPSLSCTHDANAWPSDRYAGLPAPRPDERVILWLQNSHATEIPAGAISLDRMGAESPVALNQTVPPYATVALDVASLLPGLHWPAQIELRAGRHVVRPRYEVVQNGRSRIAHVNVERADLQPDPGIPALSNQLGRGYLLPFPILPQAQFRTILQPTPMATSQTTLPIRLDLFAPDGTLVAERFLGCLPRQFDLAVVLDEFEAGHGELVYDFRDGGEADGWLHTLVRFEHRQSGHSAETSFGAHIYNTPMTYRGEPQSYRGAPPGLTTRLFLKLGDATRRSFAHLIYPASAPWHAASSTSLILHDAQGAVLGEAQVRIACSGSLMVWPHEHFSDALMRQVGLGGYVLIRDTTCRLFGYHGLMDGAGGFSLDHMFGF
jgi:hypothetical protein